MATTNRTVTVQRCPSGGRGYVVEIPGLDVRRYVIGSDGNAVQAAIQFAGIVDGPAFAALAGKELKSRRRVSLLVEVRDAA